MRCVAGEEPFPFCYVVNVAVRSGRFSNIVLNILRRGT